MKSCARITAVLSLFTLLFAVGAAAQLKPKLPKVKLPGTRTEQSAAKKDAPKFSDRVLEITDGRVDQLIAGYHAEAAALDAGDKEFAGRRQAYEADLKSHPAKLQQWENDHRAWAGCQAKHVKPAQAKAEQQVEQAKSDVYGNDEAAFERKMKDVQSRIEAAKARGDMNEVMRLADSVQKAMNTPSTQSAMQASADLQAAGERCGAEPEKPEPPSPPMRSQADLETAGATAARLTPEQYAVMKERVRYAVDAKGNVDAGASQYAFSETELAVLTARGKDIAKAWQPLERQEQ